MVLTCVGAWVVAAVATHVPAPELSGINVSDKTLHLIGYFGLAALFGLSLTAYGVWARHRIPTVFGVMMVYAAVDETTQELVGRHAALDDWLADVIGVILAVVLLEIALLIAARVFRPSRQSPSP